MVVDDQGEDFQNVVSKNLKIENIIATDWQEVA